MPMTFAQAHRHCIANRTELLASEICGCFYCLKIYPPAAITEWSDETNLDDQTGWCPHCGIDSILGSASGLNITSQYLKAMQKYAFSEIFEY